MDELRRQAVFLTERWSRFPRGQRIGITAAFVACVVGFSFVIGRSTNSDWQPVCGGRVFVGKELAATQTIWRQQGLKNFRKVGQQLCVPQNELTRYEALVPKSKHDEAAASSEWEKQLARTNLFSTSEVVEQHRDNALRNELRRLIKAIPAIADADVIWARSKGKLAFSSRPKVTATVNVTPRDGYDVTPELAQSLRTAVANMVADLNAQDVVVLDQSTGLAITDHMDQAVVQQQRQRQLERLGQQVEVKLTSALSSIPGVVVKVTSIDSHERNHFVARPIRDDVVTSEPRLLVANSLWTHDAPQDVVTFANTFANIETTPHATSTNAPTKASMTEQSTLGSNAQQPRWRVSVVVPPEFLETQSAQTFAENNDSTTSIDDDLARLQQLVISLLPPNAPATEVVVQPATSAVRQLNVPETQSAISAFAAWPHAVCLLASVVLTTSFARKRSAPRTPKINMEPHTIANAVDAAEPVVAEFRTPSNTRHADSKPANQAFQRLPVIEESLAVPAPNSQPITGASACDQAHAEAYTEAQAEAQPLPRELCRSSFANTANHVETDPIEQLLQTDSNQLADALRHERPQAIAVLLTRFTSRHASETLAGLPTDLQIEVIRRLKSLGDISPELVHEIARSVARRLRSIVAEDSMTESSAVNRIAHLFETPASSKVCV